MESHAVPVVSLKAFAIWFVAALALSGQVARAEIKLTDETNIRLSRSLVATGGDIAETPDVTSGLGVVLVPFKDDRAEHYSCCGPNYGAAKLTDGDVGKDHPSDGLYAIANAGPEAVVLDFQGNQEVGGIVIYDGYGNRDDGTYTLKDMNGTVLGAWTISNTAGGTNLGTDSLWLTFKTPVTTNKLVIDTQASEGGTVSFREIQVLSANQPAIQLAVIGDSYTAGYGDSCDVNVCSDAPPVEWTKNYAAGPNMPSCGQKYGWAPKLAWFLQNSFPGRTVEVVGQCTRRFATSYDMYAAQCTQAIAATNPTHTIIYAGLNDAGNGWTPGTTWWWVSQIGYGIGGKRIHVQGNGEINPVNWDQNISGGVFLSRTHTITINNPKPPPQQIQAQPCNLHPNGANYWIMAQNLLWNIQW